MPPTPDKCRLLHCPYQAPALRVGDRADCLMRGTVDITSWTDARISGPRCRRAEGKSYPSLLLDTELGRAVRTEAAAAVMYWWGASRNVVRSWRRFLDVDRLNYPGTHRVVQASAAAGGEAVQAKEWTDAERQARREAAKVLDLGRNLVHGYHGPWWTEEELALLGTLPDAEVAARIGSSVNAVRVKRRRAGIASVYVGQGSNLFTRLHPRRGVKSVERAAAT
jgi:hypothetical protein